MIRHSSQTDHCTHLALSTQDFSCDDIYMVYLDTNKFENFGFWANFFSKTNFENKNLQTISPAKNPENSPPLWKQYF